MKLTPIALARTVTWPLPGRRSLRRALHDDGEPVFSTTTALGIYVSFSDSAVRGPVQGAAHGGYRQYSLLLPVCKTIYASSSGYSLS